MDCVRCLPVDLRAGTCPPSSVKPYWARRSLLASHHASADVGHLVKQANIHSVEAQHGRSSGWPGIAAQQSWEPNDDNNLVPWARCIELRRIQWERGITRSTNVQQLKRAASFHGQVLELGTDRIRRATPFVSPPGNLPKSASASSPPPGALSVFQSHSLDVGNP